MPTFSKVWNTTVAATPKQTSMFIDAKAGSGSRPDAADDDCHEQQQNEAGADEAELLAYDGEA